MADLSKLTDKEIEQLLEAKLNKLMAGEKTVAPEGATRDFSLPRSIGAGAINAMTGGALPELAARGNTLMGIGAHGINTAADALGVPDLMGDTQMPNPAQEFQQAEQGMHALKEEHPYGFMGGEIAGFMGSPANRAASAAIGTLDSPLSRVGATASATGAEDLGYNYSMGMRGDDLMDNALTAVGIGGAAQTLGEGLNLMARKYGQSKESGKARALDQTYTSLGPGGIQSPSDLAEAAYRAGPEAVAADIVPSFQNVPFSERIPTHAISDFTNFMAARQKAIPNKIKDRVEQSFPDLKGVITPGQAEEGIEAFRESLQPQYTEVLNKMDQSVAQNAPGSAIRDAMEKVIARKADGSLRVGAPFKAYKNVVRELRTAAEDILTKPEVNRLKRAAGDAAYDAAIESGATRREATRARSEALDEFDPLDHVEFTPTQLHNIKQDIDGFISDTGPLESGARTLRRGYIQARNMIANDLNQISPEYMALNKQFAGSATASAAYDFGNKLLKEKTDPRDIVTQIKDLEPGDIQFLLEGFKHSLFDQLTNVDTISDAKKLLRQPKLVKKLSTVMGEPAANMLIQDLTGLMQQMKSSDKVVKNWESATTKKLAGELIRSWRNLVDLGLVGGVVANAVGTGAVKGPGLYSGAFLGSARRLASGGPDLAQAQAFGELGTMPAREFADLMSELPGTNKFNAQGYVPGATATSAATDPIITGEGVVRNVQGGYESLMDLLDQATR